MKTKREVICSQQLHCLSCPLSVMRTGKDCRELTAEEISKYKEENEMTDTDMLYMASLEKRLETAEAENAALKQRISELESKHHTECGQIAHYDDELTKAKELLKSAVGDMKDIVSSDSRCRCCEGEQAASCAYIKCWTWRYEYEALALIGEDINVNTREGSESNA